jgi:hypothetical protein
MSDFRFFSTHRTWEDWLGMLLGVLIVVSPWFPFSNHDVMDAERSTMILNTFVVGMLIFGLGQLEYVALQRWEEVGEIALGLWLIASPSSSAIPATRCSGSGTSCSAESRSSWAGFSSGRIGA